MKISVRLFLAMMGAGIAANLTLASELGERLDRELKGGWAVLDVEAYSGCGDTYSDNQVNAAGVASKAPHGFAAGELVRVDDVKVKKQRVDLLLTLAAPLRVSRMDGPFELYDLRQCRVQLMIFVPREVVKNRDFDTLLSAVKSHVTLFRSRTEAELSDDWNGREAEPFPDDYEETLYQHAIWKAEETNTAVHRGIEDALTEAAEVIEDLDDDTDYLAGFGEGAESMSSFSVTSCGSLLNVSFASYKKTAPADRPKSFKDGWKDGQKLSFHVLLADRLRSCLVPMPTPPAS